MVKRTSRAEIRRFISDLAKEDGMVHQRARLALVEIGEQAVPYLAEALKDPRSPVRWEAAKALAEIASLAAAPALVDALEDRDGGVRWLAGEALLAMGREGLMPLFQALTQRSDSPLLREGAHHVLFYMLHGELDAFAAPVLEALDSAAPQEAAMGAAQAALNELRRGGS